MLCPNCQQDTLLQGKEKQVCINCGYSQDSSAAAFKAAKLSHQAVLPTKPHPKTNPERAMATFKTEPKASSEHKSEETVPKKTESAPTTKVDSKKAEDEQAGESKMEFATRELDQAGVLAQDFAINYRNEVDEVLGGQVGLMLKRIGIGLGVILAGLIIYTFLR